MESVHDKFNRILGEMTDKQFWDWVASWKDPIAIIEEAENWNEDTKRREIRKLERLI